MKSMMGQCDGRQIGDGQDTQALEWERIVREMVDGPDDGDPPSTLIYQTGYQ